MKEERNVRWKEMGVREGERGKRIEEMRDGRIMK